MTTQQTDYIDYRQVSSLTGLFNERINRSADAIAYQQYDEHSHAWHSYTWQQMGDAIKRWQSALAKENLAKGARVGIMLPNSIEWVQFDQAALGLGLVIVPLYMNDHPDNVSYILDNAGVQVLLVDHIEQWHAIAKAGKPDCLQTVILRKDPEDIVCDPVVTQAQYLPNAGADHIINSAEPANLASIVYTSGTTGKPKGVMLSHENILWNAYSGLQSIKVYPSDHMLSFLPLSHTLERSIGYYLSVMAGAQVSYSRSVAQLGEDLIQQKPTVLISVPRIFERVYAKVMHGVSQKSPTAQRLFKQAVSVGWRRYQWQQGKASWHPKILLWPILSKLIGQKVMAKLGGNMRFAIAGGAAMPSVVAQTFIGLGLPIVQGYGLTETSPVISVNPLEDNDIESVGIPLQDVQTKIGNNDELMTLSPGVMQGYWRNQQATDDMIDQDGWLHTGDKAKIVNNHIIITGRIKEIIVLSNGEKLPPNDMEQAICLSPLIEQVVIVGESRPYLSALVVLAEDHWKQLDEAEANSKQVQHEILRCISQQLTAFPGYAKVHTVYCSKKAWTVENGYLTPTLKLKRAKIMTDYATDIETLYEGH